MVNELVATEPTQLRALSSENPSVMSMSQTQFATGLSWSLPSQQHPIIPVNSSNDQQAIQSDGSVPSQMQGNAYFPWMYPNQPAPFPPPWVYSSYGSFVHPSHAFSMMVPSSSQASSMPSVQPTANMPLPGPSHIASSINVPFPYTLSGPLTMVPNGYSNVSQPIATANVQSSSTAGLSRLSAIERPSFPYFRSNDPREFAMLNMALTNLLPAEETEQYKYHILLDHLKLDAARHLALAYSHDSQPYTTALKALQRKYGQPHHLASIQRLPAIRSGDSIGFSQFALRVQALVGMLQSWGQDEGAKELASASHVHQILSKLPAHHVFNFARYARTVQPDVPFNQMFLIIW